MDYKILEKIVSLKRDEYTTLELNFIQWGNNKPTLDLRKWHGDSPDHGFTLNVVELLAILKAYSEYDNEFKGAYEELVFNNSKVAQEEIVEDCRDFYIYSSENEICNHDKQNIKAKIRVYITKKYNNSSTYINEAECLTIRNVILPALRCPVCGKYFIKESVYDDIVDSKAVMLCKTIKNSDSLKVDDDYYSTLRDSSILRDYGYSVNQQVGLSSSDRQAILSFIISEEILSKNEVISYIQWFIKYREGSQNMKGAVKRWKEDLLWLKGTSEEEYIYNVRNIIRY